MISLFRILLNLIKNILKPLIAIFSKKSGGVISPSTLFNLIFTLFSIFTTLKGFLTFIYNICVYIANKFLIVSSYLKLLIKQNITLIMVLSSTTTFLGKYFTRRITRKLSKPVKWFLIAAEFIGFVFLFVNAHEMNAFTNGVPGFIEYLSSLYQLILDLIYIGYEILKNKFINFANIISNYLTGDDIFVSDIGIPVQTNKNTPEPKVEFDYLSKRYNSLGEVVETPENTGWSKWWIIGGIVVGVVAIAGIVWFGHSYEVNPTDIVNTLPDSQSLWIDIKQNVVNGYGTVKSGTVSVFNWSWNTTSTACSWTYKHTLGYIFPVDTGLTPSQAGQLPLDGFRDESANAGPGLGLSGLTSNLTADGNVASTSTGVEAEYKKFFKVPGEESPSVSPTTSGTATPTPIALTGHGGVAIEPYPQPGSIDAWRVPGNVTPPASPVVSTPAEISSVSTSTSGTGNSVVATTSETLIAKTTPTTIPSAEISSAIETKPWYIVNKKSVIRQIRYLSTSSSGKVINYRKESKTFIEKFDDSKYLLTNEIIGQIIDKFWLERFEKLRDNQYIILLFRVHYYVIEYNSEGHFDGAYEGYLTLTKVHRVLKSDKEDLIEALCFSWNGKDDWYNNLFVKRVIIEYWVKDNLSELPMESLSTLKNIKKISNPEKEISIVTEKIHSLNVPLNRDYKTWGVIVETRKGIKNKKEIETFYSIQDINNKFYHIYIYEAYSKIEIFNNNKIMNTFFDYDSSVFVPINLRDKLSDDLFVRTINNSEFYIQNNKILVKTIKFKTDFLKPISKEKKNHNKIITLDIETRNDDGVLIPYCVCFYDGKDKFSFYVTDYDNNFDSMLKHVLTSLLKPKYSGYKVYCHNFSGFDGIFLMNSISTIESSDNHKIKINPVMRDGKFINIKINYGKYNISFRDSLLILPLSLKKLSNQFKVDHLKTNFPHNFLNSKFNDNVDLNYVGKIPNFEYFNDHKEYIEYFTEIVSDNTDNLYNWNLRNEAIKYCLTDCISLYEVLEKFNNFIFDKFKIIIHKYPTLPSITFAIFRSNYLKDVIKAGYHIPLIKGKMFKDLKLSYTGGSTDMFIPSNLDKDGNPTCKIFCNDVNSLYPTNMAKGMNLPVLSNKIKFVTYFEGDISLVKNKRDIFGFFNSTIETTGHMDHPILQVKMDTKPYGGSGIRTISPLGKWNAMYFSEELYNAEKYHYGNDEFASTRSPVHNQEKNRDIKFFKYDYKIHSGYTFDKFPIFAGFVEELFEIKKQYKPGDPWYLISKNLMNQIYGRFGMDPNFVTHQFIDSSELDIYLDKYETLDFKELDSGKVLISFMDNESIEDKNYQDKGSSNVSISIASAITAYARVFMSKFKNNPNYRLFYTDTDSLYTDKELPSEIMGSELGQFKLENVLTHGIFAAPKVYAGITIEGKEISKVKGLKTKISFEDMKSLLIKNESLSSYQEKWFRHPENSNITIKDQVYKLSVTQNKRKLIYENNRLIGTTPFVIGLDKTNNETNKDNNE